MRRAKLAAAWCTPLLVLFAMPVRTRASPEASPLLPSGHWAVEAVDRLDALGLLRDWMPAQKSVPVLAVAAALEAAEAEAEVQAPALSALVRRWRARFAEEWPGVVSGRPVLGASVGVGIQTGDAVEDTTQPVPAGPSPLRLVAGADTPYLVVGGAARAGAHVAAAATIRTNADGPTLVDGDVVAAVGWLSVAVGRARPGFGFSRLGGVMLSGEAVLDRIELFTTRPVALGRAGTWTADTFVARLPAPRHAGTALLWATSFRWRVHPRLTLGGQRAVIFGGEPWNGFPVWDRVRVLAGVANVRGNNMLAVSARWRMPTGSVLPLTLDVDWGTDDDPLAAVKVPGVVAGVSTPIVGTFPVALGVEYAFFGRFCCRSPQKTMPWYSHHEYVGGWAVGQAPLGDPLGGDGRALRLRASADAGSGLRVSSAAWVQERFSRNLYSPHAGGQSVGAELSAQVRLPRTTIELRGGHERSSRWNTTQAALEATVFF
jgi:Capsule assembly protein Wzi